MEHPGLELVRSINVYHLLFLPSSRVFVYKCVAPISIQDVLGTNYVFPGGVVLLFATRFGTFAAVAATVSAALRQLHTKLNLFSVIDHSVRDAV